MRRLRVLLASACLLEATVLSQGLEWDLQVEPPPPDLSRFYFSDTAGGVLGEPMAAGDFNGDGLRDTAAGTFTSSRTAPSALANNGTVKIVFGTGHLGRTFSEDSIDAPYLRIEGAAASGYFGFAIAAGDVDGDGLSDLVIGANQGKYASEPGHLLSGEVVILYGRRGWGTDVTALDIGNLPIDQRASFFIGERSRDRLGAWIDVGDLDGDGHADIVMAMDQSDGIDGTKDRTGAAVISWGTGSLRPELTRVGEGATPGDQTILYGTDQRDMFGTTLRVGDWDGDRNPDLAVAAGVSRAGLQTNGFSGAGGGDGPDNDRADAGETTIFWSAAALKSHGRISLAGQLPPDLKTTTLYGPAAGGAFGEELAVGDVDGDGVQDLFVGALLYQANRGAAWLFHGGANLPRHPAVDLAFPVPSDLRVVSFVGEMPHAIAGDTIACFDINGDGRDDIFMGSPGASYGGNGARDGNGEVLLLGGARRRTTSFDLAQLLTGAYPSLPWIRMYAPDSGDLFFYSGTYGDFDRDGVTDLVSNCMQGDGYGNLHNNAGEYYILGGAGMARRMAAPSNLAANLTTISWRAAQPFLGPVRNYEMLVNNMTSGQRFIATPDASTSLPALADPGDMPFGLRSVEVRRGTLSRSALVRFPGTGGSGTPTNLPPPPEYPKDVVADDFAANAGGWTFASVPVFQAPVAEASNGALRLSASDNTQTFGYWLSPQRSEFSSSGEDILQADVVLSTRVTERAQVPQVRFRMNSVSNQKSEVFTMESNDDASLSPATSPSNYRLYLLPQAGEGFTTSVDLLNFGGYDDPAGDIAVEAVTLTNGPQDLLTSATLEHSDSFRGGPGGWISGGNGNATASLTSGTLALFPGSDDATPLRFGFWSSNGDATVVMRPGRLYFADFDVRTTASDPALVPAFRIRLNESRFRGSAYTQITSTGDAALEPRTGDFQTYRVLFHPGFGSDARLLSSLDLVTQPSDQDAPTAGVMLQGVRIYSVELP